MIVETHANSLPIKMWLGNVEPSAMQQARNLAALPFAFKHIALMPDCHTGYGMPIGGILAAVGVVVPNAVGVDIGCGMCAIQTSLLVSEFANHTDGWKRVVAAIRKSIPVGRGRNHEQPAERPDLPDNTGDLPVVQEELISALYQLGTLGGGNHFIEIQKGSDGHIWIMLHSGSRNVGYKVAQRYNDLAVELNQRWRTTVPKAAWLAFLPLDSEEGQSYIREMNWCVDFAYRNRTAMIDKIEAAVYHEFPGYISTAQYNIAHNYAAMEHHFGCNVMVHRKGATRARAGEVGIIPGSQGTASYIVEGLGNPESFMSCSHGAGRAMSRSAARDRLDLDVEQMLLNVQGIIHNLTSISDLDDAPSAYKSIRDVMQNQEDLVRPTVELYPIAVVKG